VSPNIWETKRNVRDGVNHSKDGDDWILFDALMATNLRDIERNVTGWLDEVATSLNLERHPDTKRIGMKVINDTGNESIEIRHSSERKPS
jgi:hypothetical protein